MTTSTTATLDLDPFEFTLEDLDIYHIQSLMPTFTTSSADLSGEAVSKIEVNASDLNKVFFLAVDSKDMSDASNYDISYACCEANWPYLLYSNSTLVSGQAGNSSLGSEVKFDLIRKYAYDIFKIPAADLFSNEDELVLSVAACDSGIQNTVSNALNQGGTLSTPINNTTTENNLTKSLVEQLLKKGQKGLERFSSNNSESIFDISNRWIPTSDNLNVEKDTTVYDPENDSGQWYAFKFIPGDRLNMKVTYVPPNIRYAVSGTHPGETWEEETNRTTAFTTVSNGIFTERELQTSTASLTPAPVTPEESYPAALSEADNHNMKVHSYVITLYLN